VLALAMGALTASKRLSVDARGRPAARDLARRAARGVLNRFTGWRSRSPS
jgi:hypothetical protein